MEPVQTRPVTQSVSSTGIFSDLSPKNAYSPVNADSCSESAHSSFLFKKVPENGNLRLISKTAAHYPELRRSTQQVHIINVVGVWCDHESIRATTGVLNVLSSSSSPTRMGKYWMCRVYIMAVWRRVYLHVVWIDGWKRDLRVEFDHLSSLVENFNTRTLRSLSLMLNKIQRSLESSINQTHPGTDQAISTKVMSYWIETSRERSQLLIRVLTGNVFFNAPKEALIGK